jgi:translation initiation factor IF-3
MNERIRVREVRLIDAEGKQVGVVPTEEARRMAFEAGFDLVEVAPDARPPVCKIMDYGKYKYEQKKKTSGKKPHHSKLKELRLRPGTEDHDYGVKLKHAREWLEKGDKVQIILLYRGRELVHQEVGRALLDKFVTDLADLARVESSGRIDAKRVSVLLTHK